jgi:enolase
MRREFGLGIDVAANSFYRDGRYVFEGKKTSTDDLVRCYVCYFKKSKLMWSVEDPFAENDFGGFALLKNKLNTGWIVGDDLTVTNPFLIKRFSSEGLINAVIIKPNQIGTMSEACDAIRVAKQHKLKCIVSHRSGETEDTFIIHLAKASSADGVKIGAPTRERMVKFNELIRLYG